MRHMILHIVGEVGQGLPAKPNTLASRTDV